MICLSEVTLAIVREWITWLHIAFYNVGDDNNFTYRYCFMTIANDSVQTERELCDSEQGMAQGQAQDPFCFPQRNVSPGFESDVYQQTVIITVLLLPQLAFIWHFVFSRCFSIIFTSERGQTLKHRWKKVRGWIFL